MSEKKIVILYSGGADSRLMLELAHDMGKVPHCVLIDYKQLIIKELAFAMHQLRKARVAYQVVRLSTLGLQSALTGVGDRGTFEGVGEWYVPGRNLMFVAIAASIAENMGAREVWLGADHQGFLRGIPDTYQDWVGCLNDVLEINGSYPIELHTPLLGLTKEEIFLLLEKRGIKREEVFSGYGHLDQHK